MSFRLVLANAQLAEGNAEQAIVHYRRVLEIRPDVARIHNNLAQALASRGELDEAVMHLQKAVELQPDYAAAHVNLGAALYSQGQTRACVAQWRQAIELQPNNSALLCRLAWILATSADPAIRNGTEAVELANRTLQLSDGQAARKLDVLAAAQAESGHYAQAVQIANQVLVLADGEHDDQLATTVRQRIELYQAGLPYHELRR